MIDNFSIVETSDRFLLRLYTPEVANYVFSNYSEDDLFVFFGCSSQTDFELEKVRYRQGLVMYGISFTWFHIIEKSTNVNIGWCGFHKWYTNHFRAEIGYMLNKDEYKGRGYMKEALPLVLKYGFEKMNLHRVEAFVGSENQASLRLMERNGFAQEGLLKEHYLKNGKFEDSLMFGLLKSDYQSDSKK